MIDHHDGIASRRPDRYLRTLTGELTAFLDIEAGLREVLIQSRYEALVEDFGDVLDTEAGLAVILSGREPLPTATQSEKNPLEAENAAVGNLLRTVTPQVRMELRRHPDIVMASRVLSLALDIVCTLDHAVDLDLSLNRALDRVIDSDLAHARASSIVNVLEHAIDTARALAHALDQTRDSVTSDELVLELDLVSILAFDLAHDLVRAQGRASSLALHLETNSASILARSLIRVRDRVRNHSMTEICARQVAYTIGRVLGQDLPALDKDKVHVFLDDFTTSDLRAVDLDGIDLVGVRWSEHGTLWPVAVDVEELKIRSKEDPVGSGVYVIQSGTATIPNFAELA